MIRMTLALAGLLSSAAAAQSVGGPEIGFVKGGSRGDEIYLINPDATGLTKFYPVGRGATSGKIDKIALRPGGGEVAWVEDYVKVKIQAHDSLGRPVGTPRQIAIANNCAQGDLDYHSDGRLVIADGCWGVSVVAPGGSTAVQIAVTGNMHAIRWMRDGSILWHEGNSTSDMRLRKRSPDGTVTTVGQTSAFPMPHIGMSRLSDEAAVSTTESYRMHNLVTGTSQPGCKLAGHVQLSPDGTEMAYRSSGGSYTSTSTLFVQKSNCSGAPFRLMAKGYYKGLVWRDD